MFRQSTAVLAVCAGFAASGGLALAEDLVIGLASEPTSIDPHFHNLGPNNALSMHLFDRLILQDEKQQLLPGLAVSWRPVNDLTWEFKLREGVTFHDGSAFDADDVICTVNRAPNVPNSPSSLGIYLKGKSVEKIDAHTVHFTTATPYPLMPNDLSTVPVISDGGDCSATTAQFNSGEAAVGTGPYRFVSYKPGDSIRMARNEDYWGDRPAWRTVTFRPIKSGPSRVAALLAGDVDFIEGVPTTDVARLKTNPAVAVSQGVSNWVIYLHMDHFRADSPFVTGPDGGPIRNPLLDRRVRLAISKAINRDAIVARVMEGMARPAGQLMPAGFFGASDKLEVIAHDPDGAKALLAEAGHGDGFRLTIHSPNDRYVNDAKIAEAIAQMLTRVGIRTAVETMPRSVFFSRASAGGANGEPEFSFILVGWGSGSGEASSPLKALIHTHDKAAGFGSSNRGRYANPDVDAKIAEALRTVDDAKRQALLAEATEIAIDDVAIVPTHYQVNSWAGKKGLRHTPRIDGFTLAMGVVQE